MRPRLATALLLAFLAAATALVTAAALRDRPGPSWEVVLGGSAGIPRNDLVGRVGFPLGLPFARRSLVFVRFRSTFDPARPR